MKTTVRKLIVIAALLACSVCGAFAQQITKFAVVDTSRVYQSYYRDSVQVRNFERKRQEFQDEVARITAEIQQMHDRQLEYERNDDSTNALKLQTQITKRTEYLREYVNAKNAELEALKSSLEDNDEFYQKLYEVIEKIAEGGGYSMVLSLQQSNMILWYSTSVDITDEVISRLGL